MMNRLRKGFVGPLAASSVTRDDKPPWQDKVSQSYPDASASRQPFEAFSRKGFLRGPSLDRPDRESHNRVKWSDGGIVRTALA